MNMTQQELLAEVNQFSEFAYTPTAQAATLMSAAQLAEKSAALEHRILAKQKAQTLWFNVAFALGILFVAYFGLGLISTQLGFFETAGWKAFEKSGNWTYLITGPLMAFGVLVVAGISQGWLEHSRLDLERENRQLQPIDGTDACQAALSYVQSGFPAVLAWRDLAIDKREQLHQFDVDVMRALYLKAHATRNAEQAQVRNREACRVIHGIGNLDADELTTA